MSFQPREHVLVVVGLVRRGTDILLVQEDKPVHPHPYWVLPGGQIESGEDLETGLRRELQEEAGLTVRRAGRLVYASQILHTRWPWVAYGFEVLDWEGDPRPADPDGDVVDARFFSQDEALCLLAETRYPVLQQPVISYLKGEAPAGAVWTYRLHENSTFDLVSRIHDRPGASSPP